MSRGFRSDALSAPLPGSNNITSGPPQLRAQSSATPRFTWNLLNRAFRPTERVQHEKIAIIGCGSPAMILARAWLDHGGYDIAVYSGKTASE
ncbi:MAG: hypothetical protein ACU85U_05270 [Gammaproteobacteria bacterium]|jgi:hypothetical protein